MDLKNLLRPSDSNKVQGGQPEEQQSQQQQSAATPQQDRPELKHRYSSISSLVNNDDDHLHSSSPSTNQNQMYSPVITAKHSVGSNPVTPASKPIDLIKARSSITSLTNDTDVGVDGKETPSIARRLSYEHSTSESNSPVFPKKSIPRQPSLLDVMNTDKPIEFEEPVYKEPKDADKTNRPSSKSTPSKIEQQQKETLESFPKTTSLNDKSKPQSPRSSNCDFSKPNGSAENAINTPKLCKIESELEKLESLEKKRPNGKGKYKPRRYDTPPIWAQKWRSNFKQDSGFGTSSGSRFSSNGGESKKSSDSVSITGIKPYNDITRRITNWIYAQLYSTPKELRQYLELETKFGRIWDKATDRRVHLPVTTEAILDDGFASDLTFKAGLGREQYDRLKKFVVGLTKIQKDKFKTVKSDQVDRVYREAQRNQVPKHYRLTTDKSTNRIVQNIEKRKVASLYIHNPEMMFDFRLTMSIELPSSENPEKFQNLTPENERHKRRTSIFHDSTGSRFDITDVLQKVKGKNSEFETLEIEIEIDMVKLLDFFDKLETDNFSFEDLSEAFMDNARILNRELLKPIK